MKLAITATAIVEIDAILDYVSAQSPQGATRVADRLDAAFARLLLHPRLGKRTNKARVRRLVVPRVPYLIFYEVNQDVLIIIAVRHAARRPGSMPDRS